MKTQNELIDTKKESVLRQFSAPLVLCLFLLLAVGAADARNYHVDCRNPRSDNDGPGSIDQPFENIYPASFAAVGGDSIIVHPGTYREFIELDEKADDWVTFIADPPYSVVLEGKIPLNCIVLRDGPGWVKDASPNNIWYQRLLPLHGCSGRMFKEAWCDGERFPCPFIYGCGISREFAPKGSEMRDDSLFVWLPEDEHPDEHSWELAMTQGILMNGWIRVEHFIFRNYSYSGITVAYGKAEVMGNICEYNGRAGISVKWCGQDTVLVKDNISRYNCGGIGYSQGIAVYGIEGPNVFIIKNISHDNFDGGPCGTDGKGFSMDTACEGGGAWYLNNVAYRNAGPGFSINKSDNCVLVNNTSFNNIQKEESICGCEIVIRATTESGGTADNLVIRNNLVAVQGGSCRRTIGFSYPYNAMPEEVLMDHNLHFRWPDGDESTKLVRFSLHAQGQDYNYNLDLEGLQEFCIEDWCPGWGRGSLYTDPLVEKWDEGDFRFVHDSPAIDMAVEQWAPNEDFYGTSRPWGRRSDIGAFEYNGKAPLDSMD